jgi:hypothetical protein
MQLNNTWAYTNYIQSMFKHFKTKIMAFKLINDFKWCITIIMSGNLKDKLEMEGVFSLSSTPHQSLRNTFTNNIASFA